MSDRPIPYISQSDTGSPNLNWDPWYDAYIRNISAALAQPPSDDEPELIKEIRRQAGRPRKQG